MEAADEYVLREHRLRSQAIGAAVAVAIAVPVWLVTDRTTGWIVTGILAVVLACVTPMIWLQRDVDRHGVVLAIGPAGVYLGGRPGRRLAWAELERITAFVDEARRPAPPTFWTGRTFVGECRVELHPIGREPVGWDLENPDTIREILAALARHAPRGLIS